MNSNDDDKTQCKICLTDFDDDDRLRALPCTHSFHQQCIDKWLETKAECPICKLQIQDVLKRNGEPSFMG